MHFCMEFYLFCCQNRIQINISKFDLNFFQTKAIYYKNNILSQTTRIIFHFIGGSMFAIQSDVQ